VNSKATFLKTRGALLAVSGAWVSLQMVGMAGFEPTTSSSRTRRATKLRYIPLRERVYSVTQPAVWESAAIKACWMALASDSPA
jgi:hypothetical protein